MKLTRRLFLGILAATPAIGTVSRPPGPTKAQLHARAALQAFRLRKVDPNGISLEELIAARNDAMFQFEETDGNKLILDNPGRYFSPGDTLTASYTADGYGPNVAVRRVALITGIRGDAVEIDRRYRLVEVRSGDHWVDCTERPIWMRPPEANA